MKIRVSLQLMNNIHAWEYIHDSYKLSQIRLFWIYSYSQHKCQARATRMRYECDTSYKSATRVRGETQVRYEWYTNDTSATRVKNFDFDNDTCKNICSHLYIYYMAIERLHEKKQFPF